MTNVDLHDWLNQMYAPVEARVTTDNALPRNQDDINFIQHHFRTQNPDGGQRYIGLGQMNSEQQQRANDILNKTYVPEQFHNIVATAVFY